MTITNEQVQDIYEAAVHEEATGNEEAAFVLLCKLDDGGGAGATIRKLIDMMRAANREAQPVAWSYEWASCITCEGPQNFKPVIEREAPPQWAIDEGQARNVTPLYTDPPAPAVPDFGSLTKLIVGRLIDCGAAGDDSIADAETFVYNACRAAMLAAAPEVKGA